MDFRVIAHYLGKIALVCGAALLAPIFTSAFFGDEALISFILSFGICVFITCAGWRAGGAARGGITSREGLAITGLAWIMTAFFGMLPYTLGEHLSPVDGLFESVSGFTGFGATVIASPEIMPESLLLWRSLTQWLGGLGIVVFFITLLPQSGQSAVYLYQAESSGPVEDRLRPRVKEITGALVSIYAGITALAAVTFYICGMTPFDALNHALTTIGTGGFSTHSDSVMHYDSAAVEMAMTFFILVSGGSFALYYRIYARGIGEIAKNTEFKAYILIFVLGTAALSLDLWKNGIYSVTEALRFAAFQTASVSTTGFASADYDRWPSFAKCLLLFLMMIGGCAGSTAAGLKVTRAVLLFRTVTDHLRRRFHPRAMASVKLNGAAVPQSVLLRVGLFFLIYLFFILLSSALIMFEGVTMFDAIGMSVSAVSTVGPAYGVVGPTMTYAPLSPLVKLTLCVVTLLGRLEFFTLLVMMRPGFWRTEHGW